MLVASTNAAQAWVNGGFLPATSEGSVGAKLKGGGYNVSPEAAPMKLAKKKKEGHMVKKKGGRRRPRQNLKKTEELRQTLGVKGRSHD